jgi:integrase
MSDLAKRDDIRPLVERAAHYAQSNIADATKRAYRREFGIFQRWAAKLGLPSLPTTVEVVTVYLAALADGLVVAEWTDRAGSHRSSQKKYKYGSIQHAYQAIIHAQREGGNPWPYAREPITKVMRGIAFRNGTTKKRCTPMQIADLKKCLSKLRERRFEDLVIMRDKAILSLGFFASLRRAEVVALKVTDLEFTPEGLILHIRRSKTGQLAVGDTVGLVPQKDPEVCPVALVKRYLEVSGLKDGPLFRRIDPRSDAIGAKPMIPQSVAIIVQRTAELAGLDPDKVFSGHSLRAGFATTSAVKGRTLPQIMRQGRWKDQRTAMMYIRPATVWQDNPTAGLSDDVVDETKDKAK